MRSERTNESQRPMLRLVGAGENVSKPALSPFGPQRVASTTSHKTQSHQLSESLNSLDSKTQDLEFRFYEACVTLNIVMARLVELGLLGISEQGKTEKVGGTNV